TRRFGRPLARPAHRRPHRAPNPTSAPPVAPARAHTPHVVASIPISYLPVLTTCCLNTVDGTADHRHSQIRDRRTTDLAARRSGRPRLVADRGRAGAGRAGLDAGRRRRV